jgi:chromosome segregation ATPase
MEELHAELGQLQEALDQARAEGTRRADAIAGWEEAFAAAQAELETLRAAAAAAAQLPQQQTVRFLLMLFYSAQLCTIVS